MMKTYNSWLITDPVGEVHTRQGRLLHSPSGPQSFLFHLDVVALEHCSLLEGVHCKYTQGWSSSPFLIASTMRADANGDQPCLRQAYQPCFLLVSDSWQHTIRLSSLPGVGINECNGDWDFSSCGGVDGCARAVAADQEPQRQCFLHS